MIVIPMAGLSSRFSQAGYSEPKFMLEAHGKTIFRHAVESFVHYFEGLNFLFVIREMEGVAGFVERECRAMGIRYWKCVALPNPTRGQAETTALGLQAIQCDPAEEVTIFNIDTIRPHFRYQQWPGSQPDGFLEVFIGSGPQWSYAKPVTPDSDRVGETAEKREISNLCSNGLYHFASAKLFEDAFHEFIKKPLREHDGYEFYIAPLYNILIDRGLDIRYRLIPRVDVVFCGVPEEYEAFRKTPYATQA